MLAVNLHQILTFWATRWPDRPAVRCADRQLTWGELNRRSNEIAAGLVQAGVRKGHRVGILMRNRIEFVEVLYGVLKTGAALTLMNIRFTSREMTYPVIDSGLDIVITEPALVDTLQDASAEMPGLKVYTTEALDGFRPLQDLRIVGAAAPDVDVAADEVALICYTSGTTGFPKGAMLTHGNIWAGALSSNIPSGLTSEDRLLVSLPLAYTWGICQYLRESLVSGASAVIATTFDSGHLMDLMQGENITVWSSVVVLLEQMANSPRFGAADLSTLRQVTTGGASLHLLRVWQNAGVAVTQSYGLTETGGHATLLFNEDAVRKMGSSGRAVMHAHLRIADENEAPLPAGEAGEIMVKGPLVMKGYLNKPDATAAAVTDGWLKTGDIGYLDTEGFLSVIDRSKDMLKSGGLNVYPAELERVLAGIAGLEEFAIIGVSDERWGEIPVIVAHGSMALDLQEVQARCQRELADYKRPRYVVDYAKPLPRTLSGKILKRELRLEFKTVPSGAVSLKK